MPKIIDLTGLRFAELTVERMADVKIKSRPAWVCLCDCGERKTVAGESLKAGEVKCCGKHKTRVCLASMKARAKDQNRKYPVGTDSQSRLYTLWRALLLRCGNPKHEAYDRYGGAGVTICPAWQTFAGFREWALANGYEPHLTLDRKDNDGIYEPGNCRWATAKEQARNRRNNVYLTAFGETRLLIEWSEDARCRVDVSKLRKRLHGGQPPEFAMTATETQARSRAAILRNSFASL